MKNEETIFAEAAAIGCADARAAYLEQACGADAVLRSEVDGLLAAHERAAGFMESPATPRHFTGSTGSSPTGDPELEAVGATVGPYKLLERIGEGGMGVVYLADQLRPVRRRVALKIIKPGMDSRQVIARFEAERQALAMMDHPSIARVLDAGTTDAGLPYFAMELVRGVPITEYCDANHLAPRERLGLFVQVCQAVQHAHTKGVIHRDLKPTNILVALQDGAPVPKVIDFGIAKATGGAARLTDGTLFTHFAQMIGTPLYMSPEQAEFSGLDVDTRSDVYSLGVLLYELLTGTTPFDKKRLGEAALDEVRRIIREEEPPRPSTRLSTLLGETLSAVSANRKTEPGKLGRSMRGELDWIVMRCLEKDRARRYETANGLARDVERYLADEAVQACPPSGWYRFRKSARRNRGALLTALVLAVALLLGTVVSTWQALRARDAKRLAQARLVAERDATATAQAISALLQDALQSANPDDSKGVNYSVRQLLDDASARVANQLKGQPKAEAAIRATIGNAYRRLGLPHDAEPHLRAALDLRRRTLPADHPDVAQSLLDSAWNRMEGGDRPGAEAQAKEALAAYQIQQGQEANVIRAFLCVELTLLRQGRNAEAAQVADQALSFARGAGRGEQAEVASVLHNKAFALSAMGNDADAEPVLRNAIALHRRVNGNGHPETGWAISKLGHILLTQQKLAEAELHLRDALAIFREAYGADHKSVKGAAGSLRKALAARGDAAGLKTLAADEQGHIDRQSRLDPGDADRSLERAQGHASAARLREAEEAAEEAYAGLDGLSVEARRKLAELYADVGRSQRLAGALDRADRLLGRGIDLVRPLVPDSPQRRPQLASVIRQRGFALWDMGRLVEAEASFAETAALYEAVAADAPDTPAHRHYAAESHEIIGDIQLTLQRTSEAELSYRKSVAIFDTVPAEFYIRPPAGRDAGTSYEDLARLLEQTGRPQEAAEVRLKKAPRTEVVAAARLAARDARLAALDGRVRERPNDAAPLLERAALNGDMGRWDAAEADVRDAERVGVGQSASDAGRAAAAYSRLGQWQHESGRPGPAAASFQKAIEAYQRLAGETAQPNPNWFHVLRRRGQALHDDGRHAESEADFTRAAEGFEALAAANPSHPFPLHFAADSHRCVGDARTAQGRTREAEQSYRYAFAQFERVPTSHYVQPGAQRELIQGYTRLADILRHTDRSAEAEAVFDRCLRRAEEVFRIRPGFDGLILAGFYRDRADALRSRGATALADEAFALAIAAASRAIAKDQKRLDAWHARGQFHAECRHWDEAAADFGKAVELGYVRGGYSLALVRLAGNDAAGYRSACVALTADAAKTSDPSLRYQAVWITVLRPDGAGDPSATVRLAEAALAAQPGDPDLLLALGAALYRAGQFEDAAGRLTEADAAFSAGRQSTSTVAYVHLFQAMNHHRRGEHDAARRSLARAEPPVAAASPATRPAGTQPAAAAPMPWNRRLTLDLLRRQAEELLGPAR